MAPSAAIPDGPRRSGVGSAAVILAARSTSRPLTAGLVYTALSNAPIGLQSPRSIKPDPSLKSGESVESRNPKEEVPVQNPGPSQLSSKHPDLTCHRTMRFLPYPTLLLSWCSLSLAIQDLNTGIAIGINVNTKLDSPPIDTTRTATQPTEPSPLALLPSIFASSPSTRTIDPTTTASIRHALALYPLAIDGKDFAALSSIFAPDAVANYSAPLNVLTPLNSIQDTLSASLACVSTQHSLGTQIIDVISPLEARSVTYFTASHFGRSSRMAAQVATAHGQYQDLWRRQEDGSWRVVVRNLVYMSEVMGNQAVFVC